MFSDDFINSFKQRIFQLVKEGVSQTKVQEGLPYWMKKKQAAIYMNVSDKTLDLYIADGLRTMVKGGVQRISKKAADEYYQQYEN